MDPKLIGAFGLLCLCSISSSIAASMGGGEETPAPIPGAGPSADDSVVDTPAPAPDPVVAGYDYSKDDINGQYADTDASTRDICGTHCKNNNHDKNDVFTCEAFVFREEPKLCRLYDNAQITNVEISSERFDYEVYRATGAETGADYTESCDDLGGGYVRHSSGVDLNSCKKKCRLDASCKGFIHKPLGFCQLHDNNEPGGGDVCGQGYRVFRK